MGQEPHLRSCVRRPSRLMSHRLRVRLTRVQHGVVTRLAPHPNGQYLILREPLTRVSLPSGSP